MNSHSLHVLEFAKIRSALAERASFSGGAERCSELVPLGAPPEIERRLVLIAEVRRVLQESDLPIHGLPPLVPVLDRIEPLGSVAAAADLASVSKSLHVVVRLRTFCQEWNEKIPRLAEEARRLQSVATLREEIDRCIDPSGEIRENASPALRKIRREREVVRGRVQEKMNSIARSLSTPDAVATVTIRNDRYVIVVRRDRLHGESGIIHGQSSSGASLALEPASAVPLNNELAELRSAEEAEILRILTELTDVARLHVPELRSNEIVLSHLDFLRAAGVFSRDMQCVPALPSPNGGIRIRRGRHPLLQMALAKSGRPVVPLDLEFGDGGERTLIITGPNTGGKTVALKTVGLFALMHHCGLHLPAAEGTHVPWLTEVCADIGDEQSIESSLSTFSSHLSHVVQFIEDAGPATLVLLDELGVGTDPDEGAALGKAVLGELTRRGALTLVTTHYGSLKTFAHETAGIQNASLEFDRESLTPTYKFLPGIPGASEAISIARRLGFPERLLQEARETLGSDRHAVESLLADLRDRRTELEKSLEELQRERQTVGDREAQVERRLSGLQEEKLRARREALEEARRLVDSAKAELTSILDAVKNEGPASKAVGRARSRLGSMGNELDRELVGASSSAGQVAKPADPREIREGTPVSVPMLGWKGTALGPPGSNGKVLVAVGSFRLELPVTSLEVRGAAPAEKQRRSLGPSIVDRPERETKLEIDLRGRTVEEALEEVDRTLDGLVVQGANWLRIIHGKGTGALRTAITEQLKTDVRVKSFRMGEPAEGGGGVTIAVLH